jgi:hypothetical protein
VKEANHPPVAGFDNDAAGKPIHLNAKPGERVRLSAAGSSDPDGDRLSFRWFVYREAGTYDGVARIEKADTAEAVLAVPADAAGKAVHVVLEVTDSGTPPLTRYRRVVVAVK